MSGLHAPKLITSLVATLALGAGLVACGGDDAPADSATSGAPSAADFPDPDGRPLDRLITDVGSSDQYVVAPAGSTFSPGDSRFGFGVFLPDATAVPDAKLAVYAQAPGSREAQGPFPARVESLKTDPAFLAKTTADDPDSAKVVYVSDLPLEKPGEYQLAAVLDTDSGQVATRITPGAVVSAKSAVPDVGDQAPAVDTPTAASAGNDIASIDTRVPPDDLHDVNLADALGHKPVVLVFATPALCQSRVCGPVVDVAEQVQSEYGDRADFIHMEIYADNKPPKLRPQVRAYGLQTEPWLFVIDRDGVITNRIEGAFSVGELEDAVKKVA